MHVEVGADGEVYVADSSPISHGIVRLEGQLWFGVPVLPPGFGLPPLPSNANHGRVGGIAVEGSPYDGTLVIHTIDRDLTSSQFGGSDVNDRNSVWRYDLGLDPQWSTIFPTKVSDDTFFPAALASPDLARGADGKKRVYLVRVNDIIRDGDLDRDPVVLPGDIIWVPEGFF